MQSTQESEGNTAIRRMLLSVEKLVQYTTILMAIVAIIYAGVFLAVTGGKFSVNSEDWAAFGNFWGGLLSPIVSLATLYVVMKAYLAQKEDLARTAQALIDANDANNKLLSVSQERNAISAQMAKNDELQLRMDAIQARLTVGLAKMESAKRELQRVSSPHRLQGEAYEIFTVMGRRLGSAEAIEEYIREINQVLDNNYATVKAALAEAADLEKLIGQSVDRIYHHGTP